MSIRMFLPRIVDGESFTQNEIGMNGSWVAVPFKKIPIRIEIRNLDGKGNFLEISVDGRERNWVVSNVVAGGNVNTSIPLIIDGFKGRQLFLRGIAGLKYVLNVFYSNDTEP